MSILRNIKQLVERVKRGAYHRIYGEFGKVAILIGQRKTGKSETVKMLSAKIRGYKYVLKVDKNLDPQPLTADERSDWAKISKCYIIENKQDLPWNNDDDNNLPITFIFDDFPKLDDDAIIDLYNTLIDTRHQFYNIIIIAHAYDTIPKAIYDQANFLLLYHNAPINHTQLAPKVGGHKQGWAIYKALQDMEMFHYYPISFDFHTWHNPPLDSRDINAFKQMLTMKKEEIRDMDCLVDIHYEKNRPRTPKKEAKKTQIIKYIEQGKEYRDMLEEIETSRAYLWKIKCEMRETYRILNDLPDTIPEERYPEYLRDRRRNEV